MEQRPARRRLVFFATIATIVLIGLYAMHKTYEEGALDGATIVLQRAESMQLVGHQR